MRPPCFLFADFGHERVLQNSGYNVDGFIRVSIQHKVSD